MLQTIISVIAVIAKDIPATDAFPKEPDIRILVGVHGGKRYLTGVDPLLRWSAPVYEGCKAEVRN
jgi:hypothetical protein